MEALKGLVARITSRKFLLAVGAALTFIANGDHGAAVTVILAYLGVEGAADTVQRFKSGGSGA